MKLIFYQKLKANILLNILSILLIMNKKKCFFVMEFCSDGDLRIYINRNKDKKTYRRRWNFEIFKGKKIKRKMRIVYEMAMLQHPFESEKWFFLLFIKFNKNIFKNYLIWFSIQWWLI